MCPHLTITLPNFYHWRLEEFVKLEIMEMMCICTKKKIYVTTDYNCIRYNVKSSKSLHWFMDNLCLRCQHDDPHDGVVTQFHAKAFFMNREFMTRLSLSDKHSFDRPLLITQIYILLLLTNVWKVMVWEWYPFLFEKVKQDQFILLLFWRRNVQIEMI